MASPFGRERPLGAWCVLLLLAVAALPLVTAQDPPPIPSGGTGEEDDLALVPREWTETRRNGTVVDLVGVSDEEPGWEIAYRIHGDIAALEGTLIADADTPSPRPVFNTGLRLDRIQFKPPLRFEDGSELAEVFPPGLNWTFDRRGNIPAWNYPLIADVPLSEAANVSLAWQMRLPSTSAMAGLTWTVFLPSRGRAPDMDLNETKAHFRLLYDFGDRLPARAARQENTAIGDTEGAYLFRGNASATLRISDNMGPHNLNLRLPGSNQTLGNDTRLVRGPIQLEIVLPVSNVSPFSHSHQDGFHVWAEFGYLVDLPDPVPTETSTDPANEGAPPAALPVVLLAALAAAACLRRTEAHR